MAPFFFCCRADLLTPRAAHDLDRSLAKKRIGLMPHQPGRSPLSRSLKENIQCTMQPLSENFPTTKS